MWGIYLVPVVARSICVERHDMNPLVSVIVPTFNTKFEYLERCLRSFAPYIGEQIECIVVDDGSDSSYASSLKAFIGRIDQPISLLLEPHGGQNHARQAGLDIATGDYVWFVDSDDLAVTDNLPALFGCLDAKRPKALQFNFRWLGAGQTHIIDIDWPREYSLANTRTVVATSGALWRNVFSRKAITDSDLRLIQGARLGDDVYTTLSWFVRLGDVATAGIDLYRYVDNPFSITKSLPRQAYREFLVAAAASLKAMGDSAHRFSQEVEWVAIRNILLEGVTRLLGDRPHGMWSLMRAYYRFMHEYFPSWHDNDYLKAYMSGDLPFMKDRWHWQDVQLVKGNLPVLIARITVAKAYYFLRDHIASIFRSIPKDVG